MQGGQHQLSITHIRLSVRVAERGGVAPKESGVILSWAPNHRRGCYGDDDNSRSGWRRRWSDAS